LDEAEALIEMMRGSLAELERQSWFWTSKTVTLGNLHAFYHDRLDLSEERLERCRKTMSWRDEQLQNNFGIVRDGNTVIVITANFE
jgi:predicted alpha-1,6-mannanase (GH76 family)